MRFFKFYENWARGIFLIFCMKLQQHKVLVDKYMIASTKDLKGRSSPFQIPASTQITNAFIAVLVFKSLSRKDLLINKKDSRSC